MITKNISRVLVLAPHTDDGEFGCGGTIARLKEGIEVHMLPLVLVESVLPEFLQIS